MKRILTIIGIVITLIICCSILAIHIWIGQSVKENINIAKQLYPGTAEDSLISFLLDENNSYYDRTHIAIWTLGQIQSEKALPLLYEYYKDDPEGKTCYGKHDSALCQYEINKAIIAIERRRLLSHARLKKMN